MLLFIKIVAFLIREVPRNLYNWKWSYHNKIQDNFTLLFIIFNAIKSNRPNKRGYRSVFLQLCRVHLFWSFKDFKSVTILYFTVSNWAFKQWQTLVEVFKDSCKYNYGCLDFLNLLLGSHSYSLTSSTIPQASPHFSNPHFQFKQSPSDVIWQTEIAFEVRRPPHINNIWAHPKFLWPNFGNS